MAGLALEMKKLRPEVITFPKLYILTSMVWGIILYKTHPDNYLTVKQKFSSFLRIAFWKIGPQ